MTATLLVGVLVLLWLADGLRLGDGPWRPIEEEFEGLDVSAYGFEELDQDRWGARVCLFCDTVGVRRTFDVPDSVAEDEFCALLKAMLDSWIGPRIIFEFSEHGATGERLCSYGALGVEEHPQWRVRAFIYTTEAAARQGYDGFVQIGDESYG